MIHIPKSRIVITEPQAGGLVRDYMTENPAVTDLYDRTILRPHDEVEPVDVLALNALCAYDGSSPMTRMTRIWQSRARISSLIRPVTTEDLISMQHGALDGTAAVLAKALDQAQTIPELGGSGTRVAKLFHRLRPNIMPIWDKRVGARYGGVEEPWKEFIAAVHSHVREHAASLLVLSNEFNLPVLRIWDIILWQIGR